MSSSSVPAREAAPTAPAIILAPAAFVAPPLAVFAPLALAPLLALTALALIAADGRQVLSLARAYRFPATLCGAIAAWAALTALWSPIPGHSLFEALRFLAIAAAGFVTIAGAASLGPIGRLRTGYALLAGLALALLLLQVELRSNEAIAHAIALLLPGKLVQMSLYDRGITVLVIFVWPAAALLAAQRRWLGLALLVAAVGFTAAAFRSHASLLAFAMAPVAGVLAWRLPRLAIAGLVAATLMLAFALPVLAPRGAGIARIQQDAPMLQPSAIHRLAIWRFVGDRIAERPLLGWGMDSARAIPGGQMEVDTMFPELHLPATAQVLPLHPHDAALQWRLELGVPGIVLVLLLVGSALWYAAQRPPGWQRALIFAYAATAWTVAMLSFGAWQAWWLSTLWLGTALLLALGAEPPAVPQRLAQG